MVVNTSHLTVYNTHYVLQHLHTVLGVIWFQEFPSRTIYASHYDEARVTRQNTIDPLDGKIAKRTYEGHQELRKITGKYSVKYHF